MEKIIRGLKRHIPDATDWESKEEQRFIRYFEMVQKEASLLSCIFFFDNIEGHSAEFESPVDFEDITGWLISFEKADQFEREWEINEPSHHWDDFYFDADWEKTPESVKIIFNKIKIF